MLNTTIKNVSIKGVSVVVPQQAQSLLDDKTLYGGDEKKLKRVMRATGFHTRRVVDASVTASDLCEAAARNLMRDMKIAPSEIDGVVFVSQTPDYHMPATACILQHKLGLSNATAAFDVNQGCAGYTYGLWIASMMVSNGCNRILLLVGDTSSKYTDMFKEHNSAPIFGDAGSATLLERDNMASPLFFDIGTDGGQFEAIMSTNGGFRSPPTIGMFYEDGSFKYGAQMDGLKVMEFTLSRVPESIRDVLEYAGVSKDKVDYFIFHQANKFILENIAGNADIPVEKIPMETLSKYGNQSCTSIAAALCDALLEPLMQQKLLLCLSGFGIGLSWASVVLETNKIYCSGIRPFERT